MRTAIAIAALWATAAIAQDEIQTWTDDKGEVHYTNDPAQVPAQYRRTMKRTADNAALSVIPSTEKGGDAKASTTSSPAKVQAGASKSKPDETYWRARFREVRRKISQLEEELRLEKAGEAQLYRTRAQAADGSLGDPRYAAAKRRIAELTRDLDDAKAELRGLNEAAADANVPESWR
jgi:hypothetical protein